MRSSINTKYQLKSDTVSNQGDLDLKGLENNDLSGTNVLKIKKYDKPQ